MASKRQLGNRAAWRTPVISWDMPVPCGVAYVGEGLAFSCVHALPSPLSADGGPSLSGGLSGTLTWPDFSEKTMEVVCRGAFAS
jgi:hypothetical protein